MPLNMKLLIQTIRFGGWMHDCDKFDADLFFISAKEANYMDPQQRLLLQLSYQLVETCKFPDLKKAAVFIGIQHMEYKNETRLFLGNKSSFAATGSSFSVAAGRISYIFGCHGPSASLDTACSSALVAISQCRDHVIRDGYKSFAGSVNLMLSHETFHAIQLAGMLSDDGRCKTLDSTADGYGRSEATSMSIIVLDEAEIDKFVSSAIVSTAINQDGRSSSLTAPNGPSQRAVIMKCLDQANMHVSSIRSIFLHGTGTPLGDPIEVGAIVDLCDSITKYPSLLVPKSQFGHAEPASGAISVNMSRTSLNQDRENPVLHLSTLNKALEDIVSRQNVHSKSFNVPRQSRGAEIENTCSGESRQGVSSFAFQGTNSHLIMAGIRSIEHHSVEFSKAKLYLQKSFWPWRSSVGRVFVREEAMWIQVDLQHPQAVYLWDHSVRNSAILPASYLFNFAISSMGSISGGIPLGSINNALILGSTRLPKTNNGEALITACIRHNTMVISENITSSGTKIFSTGFYSHHDTTLVTTRISSLRDEGTSSRRRWLTKLGEIPLAAAIGTMSVHLSQDKKQTPPSPAILDCTSQITSAFKCGNLKLSIPISLEHGKAATDGENEVTRKWALGYLSTSSRSGTFRSIYKGATCHSFEFLMQFDGFLSTQIEREIRATSMRQYSISPMVDKIFHGGDAEFFCGGKNNHLCFVFHNASTRSYSVKANPYSAFCPLTFLQLVQSEKRESKVSFVSPFQDSFIPSRSQVDLSSFSIAKAAVEEDVWLKARCIRSNPLSHRQIKYEKMDHEPLECHVETGFLSSPEIYSHKNEIKLKSRISVLDHAKQWHVLGGTGSIGTLVSIWLTFCSEESQVFIYSKRGYKRSISNLQCDFTSFMTDTTGKEPSSELNQAKPLSSWVFSQGVLSDYQIFSQSPLTMKRAISSKLNSFENVHHSPCLNPISKILIFSSITSAFPNKGQVNYSTANLLLELAAREHVKKGAEIICIQWGPWSIGMTTNNPILRQKIYAIGMGLISPTNGLFALEGILVQPTSTTRLGTIGLFSGSPMDLSPRQSFDSDAKVVVNQSRSLIVKKTALKGFVKDSLKRILSVEIEEDLFMDSGLDSLGTSTFNLILSLIQILKNGV